MTSKTILDLVKQDISINKIMELTGLSNKELNKIMLELKTEGYEFIKKNFYSGDIVYKLKNDLYQENLGNVLFTSNKDNLFRAILVSDLHAGNKLERLDLMHEVYNFAINNGYRIILNGGDLIDGHIGNKKEIEDINKQIEYMVGNYPYDKNILNFICYGNHDYSLYKQDGINVAKSIENRRPDMNSLGYGFGRLRIKNDSLYIYHPKTGFAIADINLPNKLVFSGHYHQPVRYRNLSNMIRVEVPTLSNIGTEYPGFITIDINIKNGMFKIANIETYLYIDNNFVMTSSYELELPQNNEITDEIKYEEEVDNNKVLSLTPNRSIRLSQIDKFRKKFRNK